LLDNKSSSEISATSDLPSKLPTIAVLPFVDLSPEKDQDYFCDGIAEEIIITLAQVEGIRVISRNSIAQFRDSKKDIREIGQVLDADFILEGSVRKVNNKIRVTAQLIDIAGGYYLWSGKYDRNISDIFTIQDEIATAIVDKLKVKLIGDSQKIPTIRRTNDIEAYNHYLRGRYYWNRRYEGGLQKSLQYFQRSIENDPLYAPAYAGLADSFNIIAFYNFLPPHEACKKAKFAAAKALELDPELAEAHTAMGWVKTFYDWDWEGAEKEFKLAIKLNPNYSIAHHYYALFMLTLSRFEEAFSEMQLAIELDPLAPIIGTSMGAAYYFYRDHDKAIIEYERTLNFEPNFAIGHAFLAGPYVVLGDFSRAKAECQLAQKLAGESVYPTAFLAYVYGMAGEKDKAKEILNLLLEKSKDHYISSYHIALIYCGLGNYDETLIWIEKAYQERDNWMLWLKVYPVFDPLREDQRFKEIMKKVGLKHT